MVMMLRCAFIVVLAFGWQLAAATANSALSERQTLLGLGGGSYYVLAIEWEIGTSHLETHQRVVLKQYDLNSNRLVASNVLSETVLTTKPDSWEQTVTKASVLTSNLDNNLSKDFIQYSGYARRPTKAFTFDEMGLYVTSGIAHDYVLSAQEIVERIPNYRELMQYDFTSPTVEAVYSEPTKPGIKYLLAIRSGRWRSDTNSFEYVISLPEE